MSDSVLYLEELLNVLFDDTDIEILKKIEKDLLTPEKKLKLLMEG